MQPKMWFVEFAANRKLLNFRGTTSQNLY